MIVIFDGLIKLKYISAIIADTIPEINKIEKQLSFIKDIFSLNNKRLNPNNAIATVKSTI